MDFYAHQERARAASRRLTALFVLSLIVVVAAVNGAAALGWMLLGGGTRWPPYFFATNTMVTLLIVFGGAWVEWQRLRGGGAALEALARGEERGTRFLAAEHVPARKAWIANQPVRGALEVDAGALRALEGGKSLLPGGVTAVEGAFTFGDAVEVRHAGARVGVGLTNYGSDAARRIIGRHTRDIALLLGHKDYDEVIHRDNLVLGSAPTGR